MTERYGTEPRITYFETPVIVDNTMEASAAARLSRLEPPSGPPPRAGARAAAGRAHVLRKAVPR